MSAPPPPPFAPGGPPVEFAGAPPEPLAPYAVGPQPDPLTAPPAEPPPAATGRNPHLRLLPALLMAIGGVLGIVGAALDWASYTVRSTSPSSSTFSTTIDELSVSYDGLVLTEGRIVLILAVAVLILAALAARFAVHGVTAGRRPIGIALLAIAFVIVATALTSAIGHPSVVATFVRNIGSLDETRISIPNGPGVWVAAVAGVVVAAAGLVTGWTDPEHLLGHLRERQDAIDDDDASPPPDAAFGGGTYAGNDAYADGSDRIRL